jgi:hypothetical protein
MTYLSRRRPFSSDRRCPSRSLPRCQRPRHRRLHPVRLPAVVPPPPPVFSSIPRRRHRRSSRSDLCRRRLQPSQRRRRPPLLLPCRRMYRRTLLRVLLIGGGRTLLMLWGKRSSLDALYRRCRRHGDENPHHMSVRGGPQSTYIYRVPQSAQCMSLRWNWDSPTPSPTSECDCAPPAPPPRDKERGGHTPAGGGVPIPTTG